jgi:23S rRNA (cytidine1920-2'-O)/16S rRNA (cytidine1409-2'-O)-methyltransferase
MKERRERLDVLLVTRELVATREKARAVILAGDVLVNEQRIDKPGTSVPAEAAIRLKREPDRYVGRGAHKLIGALDTFGIAAAGRTAIDVGASTGGFTQVLLERGAARVHALDVGHNQLAWVIRSDPRVQVYEGVNFRYLDPQTIVPQPDLATVDVSFIGLELILPTLFNVLQPQGDAVVLVKPQFELGPDLVGKGGIVRDPALRAQAVHKAAKAAEGVGFRVAGTAESALPGTEGNIESFLHLTKET